MERLSEISHFAYPSILQQSCAVMRYGKKIKNKFKVPGHQQHRNILMMSPRKVFFFFFGPGVGGGGVGGWGALMCPCSMLVPFGSS